MMKNKNLICLLTSIFLMSNAFVYGKNYKGVVIQVPTAPFFVELLKAIGEVTSNTIDAQVVPRARAVYLIENKQVDIQVPNSEIEKPSQQEKLKFDYATSTISNITFVLYTNKNKKISAGELKRGNHQKYIIETDTSLVDSFEFHCGGSTNPEGSLKKVDAGIIDGYIFSQTAGDAALRKAQLKNVKRQLYSLYNIKFAIHKGSKGGEVDRMLTDGIKKLKASGRYDKLISGIVKAGGVYHDWQP